MEVELLDFHCATVPGGQQLSFEHPILFQVHHQLQLKQLNGYTMEGALWKLGIYE